MGTHYVSRLVTFAIVSIGCLNETTALAQRTPPSEWPWVVDTDVAKGCVHDTLFSPSMKRKIGYSVYLPPSYESSDPKRYPVVYYLHGAGGSESASTREFAWAVQRAVEEKAIGEAVYVFPNGGRYSGYRDWEDRSVMAETWIIKELIPHIDATYRTIPSRDGRALCGWSMGGGGSLRFLTKYPDMFCSAATMGAALGMRRGDPSDSAQANLKRNIDRIRGKAGVWMAVGENDRLRAGNESFSASLKELGVSHSLTILSDTGHNLGQLSARFHRDVVVMLDRYLNGEANASESATTVRMIADLAYRKTPETDYQRQRCKLDWYLPVDNAANFPTIVWFHGGGLQNGEKDGDIAVALAKRFAADGIAVASVSYRLSPKATYPTYIEDAAAAVAYVCNNAATYRGASDRIFVSGHSAGGYLTAMVGMHAGLLKAHGLTRKSPAGYIPVSGQMITHSTVRGERGIPRTQPIIDEAAPAYHATDDTAPFLCIVGGKDLPARSEENRYFVAAMKAAGHKAVRFLEFADRNHGTIANQMGQPDDAVAQAIKEFIEDPAGNQ